MACFILVHGAWHDARCWELVAPLLVAAGHRVRTPDLPGHGNSKLPPTRSTLKAYVEHIGAEIDAAGEPVVLIGHSMGGMVVTAVAAAQPHQLLHLVYLCGYLPRNGDSVFALIARNRGHEPLTAIELALQMSDDKRSCHIADDAIVPLFYGEAEPAVAATARQRFAPQGSLPLAAELDYDEAALATVPCSYIVCTRDRVIPAHHQRRMLATAPHCRALELASDHSPFYSHPAALAALLLHGIRA